MKRSSLLLAAGVLGIVATPVAAAPGDMLPGSTIYATGAPVMVSFVGSDAALKTEVYWFSAFTANPLGDATPNQFLFDNQAGPMDPQQIMNVFGTDEEVILAFRVTNADESFTRWYWSGVDANNPDGMRHVQFFEGPDGGLRVGLEDLSATLENPYAYDGDFNDVIFDVTGITNTQTVPEPISMALIATGLLGVGAAGRRRRK